MVGRISLLAGFILAGSLCAAAPAAGAEAAAGRVSVSGEGILHVPAATLDSLGVPAAGDVYVYSDGQGIHFSRRNGGIDVYAATFSSLYVRDRAFLIANRPLTASGTSREMSAQAAAGGVTADVASHVEVCHVEQNQFYMSGLSSAYPGEEH